METTSAPTYTILGGDGQQYGPVTAEQFCEWARDGRVNGQTQVLPAGTAVWCAASSVPELGIPTPVTISASIASQPSQITSAAIDPELDQRIRSGASWFYWVAALSVINSVLLMTGAGFGFAVGLGFTAITDQIFANSAAIAMVVSIFCSGVIAAFGYFAIKRHAWAFIVGLLTLLIDTGLCVLVQSWISVAFHAWAIVSIFMAFRASRAARG